jgi:hypothetical protein
MRSDDMDNKINIEDQFKTARDGFREENADKNLSDLANSLAEGLKTEINEDNIIYKAVKWGYDDACRTMSGIGDLTEDRNELLKTIAEGIKKYLADESVLKGAPQNKDKFDTEHETICEIWTDAKIFKDSKYKDIATYGKAQKIVNMAFKYLYCCVGDGNYEDYFKYCHVPLDSITLEWFCRLAADKKKNITKNRILSWSKIEKYDEVTSDKDEKSKDKYSYMFFQNYFREWLGGQDKITPLQAEFIYWPLTQKTLAAETFLKSLTDKENDPISDDNLKAIYDEIKEHI